MKISMAAVTAVACMAISVATSYANSAGGQVLCTDGTPIAGARVFLTGFNNCDLFPASGMEVTDANGNYIFYLGDCMLPVQACLDLTSLPPGATLVGNDCVDITQDTSLTINFTVNCGPPPPCTGQIGDFVWQDTNGNGIQDAGEPGIPGVTVDLYSGCGPGATFVKTTTTDGSGHYLFTGLCAGQYSVLFHTPAGYTHTLPLQGGDTNLDSNCQCTGTADCTVCVTLPANNTTDLSIDCGYIPPCSGSIGDFVWVDINGNGCQDSGEAGLEGVTVNLYSGCAPGATLIATTTTDANGKYLFGGLCPGTYTVSFVTPVGFNRTLAHASCDGSGNPTPTVDSDCTCDNGQPCGICVTLPTASGSMQDLTIDCGYIPQTPGLSLEKTASPTTVTAGQLVTYLYCVTNTGGMEIDNINIVDDNGTPGNPSDDFTVNPAPFNLLAGQSACFAIPHITEPLCMPYGGSNLFIGNLTINVLVNGDVEVMFVQPQSLNDNRYGTGATAATGWSGGHKFGDLTGSDECTWSFTDSHGNAVLSFQEDYISQATSVKFGDGVTINYPSGYGTLGPLGGDGKMLSGSSSNVLSCRTSLSDTMNQSPTFYGFTVNSPPETAPLSGVSIPAGWNYVNSYYVKVSHFAFGANGFGGVTIPFIHDSPSKIQGIIKFFPTNICNCVTNVAIASGVTVVGGSTVGTSANDFEVVCASTGSSGGGGACSLAAGTLQFNKNQIQLPIKDNGTANVIMNMLKLSNWPAANGRLQTVALNGNCYGGAGAALLSPPATLGTGGVAFTGPVGARTINKGQSHTLVLTFEHNVSTNPALYSGWSASFGSDASCNLTIFP